MQTIGYYISDYGYGHAARSIAIIRALLLRGPYRIVICSGKTLGFLKESLQGMGWPGNLYFRECSSDLGYILKPHSVEPDSDVFQQEYADYISSMSMEIQREADVISTEKMDLVISDVSPIPIASAELARVRSVIISNFTWYTAYRQLIDANNLAPLSAAYSKTDFYIYLAGSEEPRWEKRIGIKAGFFCRTPNMEEVGRLRNVLNPDQKKLIVYFPLGMSIQAGSLDSFRMWQNDSCLFVVSANMTTSHRNAHKIPENYTESQNYVAASDVIITKPGWGTVSEGIIFNKPLILLNRGLMNEDQNTISAIKGRHIFRLVKWDELKELPIQTETTPKVLNTRIHGITENDRNLNKIVNFIQSILQAF
ncbi:hypothetical protein [Paenibacillus ihbetae]|uniref:Glycosyl transferase family 28 C-terminal domain-containing protein n=1 Tax=Paenibacillus ihbetae TaxID=1870820 RepID=A0ABX3JTJ6_9BACL|nr:hypothetical protein [Paenibacillus ihbetae]OOC59299.1 hypothetical protein BBD40_27135 [Paenibacillus ihbetae]